MLPKSCLRRLSVSTPTSLDSLLDSLNHKELSVGGNRDTNRWFQQKGASLSGYSLFSKLDHVQKLELIVNESKINPQMDRAIGCMYGMAIGDAVGAPLEFLDATKSIMYASMDDPFTGYKSWFDLRNGDYFNEFNQFQLQRGQWTDDCSMGLCMADSLIVNQKYNGSDIRIRFWNWWFNGYNVSTKGHAFGLGGNISQSLYSLRHLEVPDDIYIVDHDRDDSGNGSIMRLAPIPIFFANAQMDDILYFSEQSSLTTHPGYQAAEACKLLSYVIVKAVHNNNSETDEDIKQFLDRVLMEYKETVIKPELEKETGLDARQIVAKRLILRLIESEENDKSLERCWNWRSNYGDIGIDITMKNRGKFYNGYPNHPGYFGSYCLDGLSMALHSVYHSGSIGGAITNAVNLLGDADSTGSIAGQIAGAFYGFNSIYDENNSERYLFDNVSKWDDEYDISTRALLLYELGKRYALQFQSQAK